MRHCFWWLALVSPQEEISVPGAKAWAQTKATSQISTGLYYGNIKVSMFVFAIQDHFMLCDFFTWNRYVCVYILAYKKFFWILGSVWLSLCPWKYCYIVFSIHIPGLTWKKERRCSCPIAGTLCEGVVNCNWIVVDDSVFGRLVTILFMSVMLCSPCISLPPLCTYRGWLHTEQALRTKMCKCDSHLVTPKMWSVTPICDRSNYWSREQIWEVSFISCASLVHPGSPPTAAPFGC